MSAALTRRLWGGTILALLLAHAGCGSSGGAPSLPSSVELVSSVNALSLGAGEAGEVDVRLAAAPQSDVAVAVTIEPAGAFVLEGPDTLTFTPSDWDRAQSGVVRATAGGDAYIVFRVAGEELLSVAVSGSAPPPPPPAPPPPPPPAADPQTVIQDLAARPGTDAGSVVLTFAAPLGLAGGAADAYVVRKSVRHLTAQNVDAAELVPHAAVPAAPGAPESITLSGLKEGQTFQFSVQAQTGTELAPFVFAVSATVPEGPVTLPNDAIALSGPATLDRAGATYYLTRDVSAVGTAFTITAPDVTLDLAGYTVTYGTGSGSGSYGVRASSLAGKVTVRGGKIVQGGGAGGKCHAVKLDSCTGVRLSHLEVDVYGADSYGFALSGTKGDVEIDANEIACRTTTVSNRHWPGVAAMWIVDSRGGFDIRHNLITSSPQWGIYLHTGSLPAGDVLVHHNRIVGTKALVVNGYMLGIHVQKADVFENYLDGESRGIHLENEKTRGARVHGNFLRVQDQTNAEYPTKHWVHGIKVENAPDVEVFNNRVIGVADRDHAEVFAIDVSASGVSGIRIERNRVSAIATDSTFEANALKFSVGQAGSGTHTLVRNNVLEATDTAIKRGWLSRTSGVVEDNVFLRDLTLGASHPFAFENFDVSGSRDATGNRVIDPLGAVDVLAIRDWSGAGTYESTREWTLRVVVRDDAGDAVPGADVTVRDAGGALAFDLTTGAGGIAEGVVRTQRITNGRRITDLTPATVAVVKAGVGSYAADLAADGRTCVVVDLSAGTAALDTEAPPAPADAFARALGASRIHVGWTRPAADAAVYYIYANGELAGVTGETFFILTGLDPDTDHKIEVKALDAGGNLSPAAAAGTIRTPPEDRGP